MTHIQSSSTQRARIIRRMAGKCFWLYRTASVSIKKQLSAFWATHIRTPLRLRTNASKRERQLEIGPGSERIPGFETLCILPGAHVDYVLDATRPLPFDGGTFSIIYASHILEHVPWYQTQRVLAEWVRILADGGRLEIWVPDGLKIAQAFVDAETGRDNRIGEDGWFKFNPDKDPCLWFNGRTFSYGDGTGRSSSPNWHRAALTPRFLQKLMDEAGLHDVRLLEPTEVRGASHGWITSGMAGTK